MSSKELLGDLMVASVKKAWRSMNSKSELSNQDSLNNDKLIVTTDNINDRVEPQDQYTRTGIISRPPSYRTIASDNGQLTPDASTSPKSIDAAADEQAEITETQILDTATSCFPPVPEDASLPPLPKPVLIPRVNPGPHIPFARTWVPELANHAITREDLIAFIDNLNILIRPHIAARAVQLAAFAIGVVPYDGAEGIAAALELMSIIAIAIINHRRCKKYFGIMNEKYFHPRKLHAEIIGPKKIIKMFKLDKKDRLVAPLSEETLDMSAQERCLKYMSKWMCELSFEDIPPPSEQTNILAKLAAWEVKHKIAKADKQARKSRKRAWKRQMKGKKPREYWLESRRAKSLDWILIQNLEDWEAAEAEKKAKKEEKKQNPKWGISRKT